MRNLSKNTLKRLLRPVNGKQPGYGHFHTRHEFYNYVGAKAWTQSNGKINNLNGDGLAKYLTPAQRREWQGYVR